MRAYELHPRDGFAAVTLVTREPGVLTPHDVRVRVHAVSLNYRDLSIARGAAKRPPAGARVIAASDGAGEVVEIGGAVTRVKVGDRVAATFFPEWIDGPFRGVFHTRALGGNLDGMLAEEAIVREDALVHVPTHLTLEEAAALPCAGVTAWHALFEAAHVGPGSTVLVQGTGGVSIFGLQLAKAAGARVIVTSKSPQKRARALAMGADHVIDYQATPTWGDEAYAWSGQGVDVVVDVGGPGTFDQSLAALRFGGTMSILGVLTGIRGEVNTYGIFHKALTVRGVYVGSRQMFEALNRALTVTGSKPVIDRVFPFEAARDAYEYLASGAHFGKVVVQVRAAV